MSRDARARRIRIASAAAALGLWLVAAGGQVRAQTPPATPATLDRAAALIESGAFDRAAAMLRELLAVDPANRRAREMLAFALESSGDLDGERRVRSALAADFPKDARIQADYGRVLERSGNDRGALAAYQRARLLSGGRSDPALASAIDRTKGRTALEIGAPIQTQSDPDANATRLDLGAAVPLRSLNRLSLLASHYGAEGTNGGATEAEALALSWVLRHRSGASLMVGPRLHVISPESGATERAAGGTIAGHAPLGPWLEVEARGEVATPWDEAAVAVLHGGRTSGALGRLYAHLIERRLLLQVGAQERRLSILGDPLSTGRPTASQSLSVAGADFVLWRKPGAAVRGEMLDEALIEPVTMTSSITVAYRHYGVSTETTPEFASLIGLAPRGSVDEASTAMMFASPSGRLGLALSAGVGRDTARDARLRRAGASLNWAPTSAFRLTLGYETATDLVTGLAGERHAGRLSFHADL